jgi:hypothetical protein
MSKTFKGRNLESDLWTLNVHHRGPGEIGIVAVDIDDTLVL